ncbi:Alpha-amylase precursor [Botrimarina hoheduenensis]|uniref:Alpha-amylase n=1 Tax=Botrimarina hoheduenensis TaxID=2528000 RepID=A0A5C5WEW8_9BACT|nr:Alpha-amylase precursor [Botrimarina hoheduenensis]
MRIPSSPLFANHAETLKRALLHGCALIAALAGQAATAQDVSAEPILQIFESKWETIDSRMADIFMAGYGRLWLPPPQRADSGGLSVGYDVFDRFDLGKPRNETLYGTEAKLKALVNESHQAGLRVNTDFIINHNGFSDNNTFDNQGTVTTADDVTFVQSGGYPGFVSQLPGLPNGEYHAQQSVDSNRFDGRLAGLIDIDQDIQLQYVRHPIDPSNPQNIPAGTAGIFGRGPANVATPSNARFYPDQALGGATYFDPTIGQNVTLYDYNTADPLAGDPVLEDSVDLIMRNARWMIQEIGVDGFRLDAVRHFDQAVLNEFDRAVFRAKQTTLLDGSPDHAFSFLETGGDNDLNYLQGFIRKDINNATNNVGGNRDALDFNLFFAIKDNLSANGFANDWRNIKNRSIDGHDEGFANNGSQGVSFARSHDDGPSYLDNVAHAYLLMRPGNAIVYMNGKEFGEGRDFPQDGRGDALGGLYGDQITTLVNLRNTHGRGNYADRTPTADQKELLFYERENSALVLLNNRGDAGYDERLVQTAFAPGTRLKELTGNAENASIDPNDELASFVVVDANGRVTVRAPRNKSLDNATMTETEHKSGYLIYGLAGPEGQMRLTDVAGADLTQVLPGSTPVAGQGGPMGPSDNFFNGRTRLTDITVVTDDAFKLRLQTTPVSVGGVRDVHADGDFAQFRINGGIDANGNGVVDSVTPGAVSYGFENFTGVNSPGFFNSGTGVYEQTIDTTALAEGEHYLTGRVYRHRNPATNNGTPGTEGDGGPALYTDFREVIYVDRLKPEAEVLSFQPFTSSPNNLDDRDLIVGSTDGTADNMHVFLDLPAGMSDAQVLQMALNGVNDAGEYDADQWIYGFFDVTTGNHAVTIVTFEQTGNSNVQRFGGVWTTTSQGLGLGDLDADGLLEVSDISGPGGFEQVLASNNALFDAAADVTADGRIDTRDLLELGPELVALGGSAAVLAEYSSALLRRIDLNGSGQTNADDLAALYTNLGSTDPLYDLNVDGVVDVTDAQLLVGDFARTVPGDFNLDGSVDVADYTLWRDNRDTGGRLADGDFDGDVDTDDYTVWATAFGFQRGAYSAPALAVPEPATAFLAALAAVLSTPRQRRSRTLVPH